MTECFGECGKHLVVSKGRANEEWFWIAGPGMKYPSFCSFECLTKYVVKRYGEDGNAIGGHRG